MAIDAAVDREIRRLVAEAAGIDEDEVLRLPGSTPLLHEPLALGSLAGARLLAMVDERLGVDVAAEDLVLDSLASLDALAAFVSGRLQPRQ